MYVNRLQEAAPKVKEETMTINFRAIEKPDMEAILNIMTIEQEAFGKGALNEYVIVPLIRHGKVFVAEDEQANAVACAYFMRGMSESKMAYLMSVAVLPNFRGQDIGTALLSFAFTHLKKYDIDSVVLTVDPANFTALSVYREKLGFTVAESSKDQYGEGEDRLIMTKKL